MPRQNLPSPFKPFSKLTTLKTSSATWRIQLEQSQLVSQISSTLLQRRNWPALLRTLNLSSKLTPALLLHVLRKTQANPSLCLSFFNWAKSDLGFRPDIKTVSILIRILTGSGLEKQSKPLLISLIQSYPPGQIVDSAIQACKGTSCQSPVLGSLVECYCSKGLSLQALDVYKRSIDRRFVVPVHSCNALLDKLQQQKKIRLARSFYGNMLRNGVVPNGFTWSIIAWILCEDGKFERIARILDIGICNSVIYNLVIDCYCKKGEFSAAFGHLRAMRDKKLNAGFSAYSSILDAACKYGDTEVIGMAMHGMVQEGLLPNLPSSDYNSIIQKLSDLGRTYAMEMFFKRACDEMIELQSASYGCMLRAFSKEGKLKEAIKIYQTISKRDIKLNDNCYLAFVSALCKEDPSEEISGLLKDMVEKGFSPCALELSNFITSQCARHRWSEVEELLSVILEKGFLPDSLCCCSLIEYYCTSRQIDSAIALHEKVEKLEGSLDATTYNTLLNGLFKERKVEEAIKVFDYMRRHNLLSSANFTSMIRGLCQEKELRKAMKLHDEMLKMGLKPDDKTYKSLITAFR
ncbi:hypothetical protein NMG60_11001247 [Bertholletia excelsa]